MGNTSPANGIRITLTATLPSEAEQLVALRIEAMRESLEHIGRFDPTRARERFLSSFEPEFTHHIEADGRRVGFVVLKPTSEFLLLDHLYVRPEWQSMNIGSTVITRILEEAKAIPLPIRVGALRNSDSNRFYVRHGFRLVESSEFDNY